MCWHDRWGIVRDLAVRYLHLESSSFSDLNFRHFGDCCLQVRRVSGQPGPYAYYLVGLTTPSVATYGIQDPSDVWKTGLNRALEILVGSLISLLVTSILWPRYAREEFFAIGSQALETAAEIVTLETASFLQIQDSTGRLEQLQNKFEQQASTLRNLLQAGAGRARASMDGSATTTPS